MTAVESGFDRLATITESGVYRIQDKCKIYPFRIQYYCECRDSDFEEKMHNVLLVYKHLQMQFDKEGNIIFFASINYMISTEGKPVSTSFLTVTESRDRSRPYCPTQWRSRVVLGYKKLAALV